MNVSSVKNLNGEVFSAVQDASLTNVVQTNSGNWQDITAYQNNSASYQPSGNYIPYNAVDNSNTAFKTNSGLSINKLGEGGLNSTLLSPNTIQMYFVSSPTSYRGSILAGTSLKFETQSDSAYVDKEKIHTWDSASDYIQNISATWNGVSTTVQSNSAQWAEGGNITVSNSGDLYKVEFDGVDLYGYKSTTTITSEPVYSAVSSQESYYIQHTPYPQWNNDAIQNLENWSAFDIISVSSNGVQIYPPEASAFGYLTALDVYYKASYLYDSNNNQLADFSGYVGKITLDNPVISSYFDKPSYYDNIARCNQFRLWFSANQNEGQLNNNHYICSVGNKVQYEPRTVEGIFVIPQSALPTYQYDNTNKISAINGSAIAAGDEFPASANEAITAYQTNSATYLTAHQAISAEEWNSNYETVTTNSGSWGGSALPISAGPGVKVNLVDNTLVFSNDETVLFTTADIYKTTAFTLTEPLTSFEKVRFEITGYTDVYAENTHQTPSANNEEITTCFTYYCKSTDGNPLQMMMGTYSSNDGLNYGVARSKFLYMSNDGTTWNGNTTDGPHIQKIVGINRK